MKKLCVILIAVFFLFGCAGMNIGIDNEAVVPILQQSAISTTGYLIAMNNQSYIPKMVEWYSYFQELESFEDVQAAFQAGVGQLSKMISDDPYLQLQIKNAMTLLKINMDGPQAIEELKKYKEVVDSFMSGVMAARVSALV